MAPPPQWVGMYGPQFMPNQAPGGPMNPAGSAPPGMPPQQQYLQQQPPHLRALEEGLGARALSAGVACLGTPPTSNCHVLRSEEPQPSSAPSMRFSEGLSTAMCLHVSRLYYIRRSSLLHASDTCMQQGAARLVAQQLTMQGTHTPWAASARRAPRRAEHRACSAACRDWSAVCSGRAGGLSLRPRLRYGAGFRSAPPGLSREQVPDLDPSLNACMRLWLKLALCCRSGLQWLQSAGHYPKELPARRGGPFSCEVLQQHVPPLNAWLVTVTIAVSGCARMCRSSAARSGRRRAAAGRAARTAAPPAAPASPPVRCRGACMHACMHARSWAAEAGPEMQSAPSALAGRAGSERSSVRS